MKIDITQASSAYRAGQTTTQIAQSMGVSAHGVGAALRRAGVTMRPRGAHAPRRLGEDMSRKAVDLYVAEGFSQPTIAAITGVSQATIGRWLRDAGVRMRPRGLWAQSIRVPEDPAVLGYIAGLLDGEGHLERRQRDGRHVSGKLAIYSTTAAPLDWLQDEVGGSVRWDYNRLKKGWKPIGSWELYRARDIAALLLAIEPYLIIKRQLAQELLALFRDTWLLTNIDRSDDAW